MLTDYLGSNTCSCKVNYYSENGDGNSPCSQCPANSNTYTYNDNWNNNGSSKWVQVTGQASCLCDPGYISATGQSSSESGCQLCPVGSDTYQMACNTWGQQCGLVQTVIGDVNSRAVLSVNAAAGQMQCRCSVGYFSSSGQGPCAMCSVGTSNTAVASIGLSNDQGCSLCDVGYYSSNGVPPCSKCTVGTSTASKGGSQCSVCDIGTVIVSLMINICTLDPYT